MSNTVIYRAGSRFLSVAVQSAVAPMEDWESINLYPNGIKVMSITMIPSAMGDRVLIEDGQLGGFIFGNVAAFAGAQHTKYFPGAKGDGVLMTPLIISASNLGNFEITFELA